jgi:hypothetical protein
MKMDNESGVMFTNWRALAEESYAIHVLVEGTVLLCRLNHLITAQIIETV